MMKKILSTILFTMGFIATAHAETPISLTPTQSQAVEKLTDSSIQILDVGSMLQIFQKAKGYEGFLKEGNPKQACMNQKAMSMQGYREYQHERAVKYVIAKNPQQIQQDLNLLTPTLIANLHTIFADAIMINLNPSSNNKWKATDKLGNDPAMLFSLASLMSDVSYKDLRNFLNLDSTNFAVSKYMVWSMQQCGVTKDDLRK